MKKILIVAPSLAVGGMEKVLINLVNSLPQENYNITIKTIYDNFELASNLNENIKYSSFYKTCKNKKIDYIKVRLYTFMLKKFTPKLLYRLLIKERYDTEIAFFRGAAIKIISGSNNYEANKLAWVHNDFTKCTGIFDWFNNEEQTKNAYRKFNKIVCVSQYAKEKFTERMGIKENVIVRYNINLTDDIKNKAEEKIEEKFNENTFKVCSVGRLVEAKGYDRLLKIHKRLMDEGLKHDLIIVGDGPDKENLMNYINDNNLNKSVYLLGSKSNPYKYIKNSDLFVCSSRWEGFSTVISEAVILEKPVITTRVSGTEELFLNNKYGLITENNEESLYEELKNIITSKKLYNYYKNKVKERSSFFEQKELVKSVEKIF